MKESHNTVGLFGLPVLLLGFGLACLGAQNSEASVQDVVMTVSPTEHVFTNPQVMAYTDQLTRGATYEVTLSGAAYNNAGDEWGGVYILFSEPDAKRSGWTLRKGEPLVITTTDNEFRAFFIDNDVSDNSGQYLITLTDVDSAQTVQMVVDPRVHVFTDVAVMAYTNQLERGREYQVTVSGSAYNNPGDEWGGVFLLYSAEGGPRSFESVRGGDPIQFTTTDNEVRAVFIDNIVSDNSGEYTITLTPVLSPLEAMDVVVWFYDQAIDVGNLYGLGSGKKALRKEKRMRNMLLTARDLIEAGEVQGACDALSAAHARCDGARRPRDLVAGPGTETLSLLIADVADLLGCE